MRRDHIDFHRVEPEQRSIHSRLENWSLYVRLVRSSRPVPMWRFTRSNSRMWEPPDPRIVIDAIDGDRIEQIVAKLPTYHREALRWAYVDRGPPARTVKHLGVSYNTLFQLVCDGRNLVLHYLNSVES